MEGFLMDLILKKDEDSCSLFKTARSESNSVGLKILSTT